VAFALDRAIHADLGHQLVVLAAIAAAPLAFRAATSESLAAVELLAAIEALDDPARGATALDAPRHLVGVLQRVIAGNAGRTSDNTEVAGVGCSGEFSEVVGVVRREAVVERFTAAGRAEAVRVVIASAGLRRERPSAAVTFWRFRLGWLGAQQIALDGGGELLDFHESAYSNRITGVQICDSQVPKWRYSRARTAETCHSGRVRRLRIAAQRKTCVRPIYLRR